MNILITSIGANSAITAAKFFRNKNVKIIGTDLLKEHEIAGSKFCDKFYTILKCSDQNFIPNIIEICKVEKVDLLIPMFDQELEVLSKQKNLLGDIKLLASPYNTIKNCNDKWQTYNFFKSNNIPTPKTYLSEIPEDIGENIIYKLREGIGTKGFIDNGLVFKTVPKDYIAQEKIFGQEYTIDCFCDKNGILIFAVPRKRIEVKEGICYKGETVRNDIFLEDINKIIKNLKFYGPFNIQVFLTPDNKQYYIEINPRIGASSIITQAAGVDVGDLIIKLVNDIDIKPINNYNIVRMNRFFSEFFFYDY
ncbi:MAG: ATP-grasp domain-containing protein [Promethearchaeota archaeon]